MDSSGSTNRGRLNLRRRRTGARWTALALAAVLLAAYAAAAASSGHAGPLRLIVEPEAGGSAPFVKLIAGARHSVDLTMYELSDTTVDSALAAAVHRGVHVRVLLNGGYYSGRDSTNASAYAYLHNHGVPVRYTPSTFALTHQKTVTVDGRLSAVMTLNFTSQYYATTRDFAVLDSQLADVKEIEAVFAADWRGESITTTTGTGDLLWSPGASGPILKLIASAHHSLDVENEELADNDDVDALCAAAHRGVNVRLVMTYATDWKPDFARLSGCGANVRLYHGEHPIYIHAKMIVADGARAFVGSQNFSATSQDRNRELGIITRSATIVDGLESTFGQDYAGAGPA
jgi:phosphatidylserine/phosphatidylglycerophosphate/cardiolipin synthase-like enzyme